MHFFLKVQLQEKNEQLHSRLEQLQVRYSELMNSKTQLSSKLIFSEEEKLHVSEWHSDALIVYQILKKLWNWEDLDFMTAKHNIWILLT